MEPLCCQLRVSIGYGTPACATWVVGDDMQCCYAVNGPHWHLQLNILADDRRTRDKQTWITTVDMQRAEHNESAELLHCTYAKLYGSKPAQSNPSRIHNHTTTLHKQHHVHMRTMFALLWCIQLPSQSISNQIGGMTHPSDSRSSLSSIWYRREEGWWMVVRTALPPCASWRSVATKCMAVVLSRPTQHG